MTGTRYILSRKILLVFCFIYFLDFLTEGRLASLFALDPSLIVRNMEFWRIFTFPLAPGSLEGFILFAATFYFISPRLEIIFHKLIFPILLFLLISMHGIIHTIIFWQQSVVLTGFEGVSIFVLYLFGLTSPKTKLRLFNLPPLNNFTLAFVFISIWSITKFILILKYGHTLIYPALSSFIFGTSSSFLTYLQAIVLAKIIRHRKMPLKPTEIPNPEELKLATMSKLYSPHNFSSLKDEYDSIEFLPSELNEDRLNEILDKISEKGKNSLSIEEIKFLDDYSKLL